VEVAIQRAKQEVDAGTEWDRVTVLAAIEKFLHDKIETLIPGPPLDLNAAIAHSDTIRKYNDLLKQLREFAEARQIVHLEAITTDRLNEFRETWKGAFDHDSKTFRPKSLTGKQKYQESLKIFFRFAHEMEWIAKNPAAKLTSYRIRRTELESETVEKRRTPLKPEEIQKILGLIPEVFLKIEARFSGLRRGGSARACGLIEHAEPALRFSAWTLARAGPAGAGLVLGANYAVSQ
jgi:hypothetical protein